MPGVETHVFEPVSNEPFVMTQTYVDDVLQTPPSRHYNLGIVQMDDFSVEANAAHQAVKNPVPEPATALVLMLGVASIALRKVVKRRV